MITILLALLTQSLLIDFGKEKDGQAWQTINDNVMGGVSQGAHQFNDDCLVFSGKISFENNGGFSSVRSPYGNYDLSSYTKVKIRYKLTGLDMAFTLEKDRPYYMPKYRLLLPKTGDQWKTINVSLIEFKEYILGRKTGHTIPIGILSEIIRMGFINAEKAENKFRLELDYIHFQ